MIKKVALLRRLELALQEASSYSEKNIVYGMLNRYVEKSNPQRTPFELFYGKLNQNTLSPSYNRKKISIEDINKGKEIARKLENSVVLPLPSSKNYVSKMKKAMEFEYDCLKNE